MTASSLTTGVRDGARRPGPYSGVLPRVTGLLPGFLRNFLFEAGGIISLLAQIVWSAVAHPRGYWGDVIEDMARTIKRSWFPVGAGIFGFLVFSSIVGAQFMAMVGAQQLFGPLLLTLSSQTFTIWVDSMVVAGVVGAALTADIGARKVREEIDAMKVMGIDPVRSLAVPRVVSMALLTTMLSVPSLFVTIVAMQFGAAYVAHVPAKDFYHNLFAVTSTVDLVAVVINSLVVGVMIGAVCSYKGFSADGGAIGLGRAVNQAVVVSFVGVFIIQAFYQSLVLGLFPGMWEMR